MSTYTKNSHAPRGNYILAALDEHCKGGDCFVMFEDAYTICTDGKIPYRVFEADLAELLRLGKVKREGRRLYLAKTLRYENSAAEYLADILRDNSAQCPVFSDHLARVGDLQLSEQQRDAVRLALSHRLSIILGGAGTGKSTLIRKIVEEYLGGFVLAAPTGKAARNLTECTGYQARTVHSALGLRPNDDALRPVAWHYTGLVVVDEASMLSVELLTGLLNKTRSDCRIVLVGDPNQLLSVGSGNVLPDLLNLGIPCIHLEQNFRQAERETALYRNVVGFPGLKDETQLCFDDSFRLERLSEAATEAALVEEAVRLYRAGESVQVLSPYNAKTRLSVKALNLALQARLNPAEPEKKELVFNSKTIRDGDRVIITQNDHERNCVNGDVGIFRIDDDNAEFPKYHVELKGGRAPAWKDWSGLIIISLAYALTVHKSQGSQYDTILFPVVDRFSGMLYRNLLYTAISRARKRVILYGCLSALESAVRTEAKPRKSMLVQKTKMALLQKAA